MKKIEFKGKKMKTGKKIALIILLVIVVLIVVGVLKIKSALSTALDQIASMETTGEVTTRDLTKSVGATGTVVSVKSKSLTSTLTNTKIASVDVEVGDTVTEGQTLLTFDTEDIEESLADAQASNSISESDAQRSVDDTIRSSTYQIDSAQTDIDSAYLSYCQAKTAYEEAMNKKNKYDAGDKMYEQYANIDSYYVQYMNALTQYENAQKKYNETVASQASNIASAYSSQEKTKLQDSSSTKTYEDQLENATLTAPFDGIVTAVNYEAGDTYASGTIITVQDCSEYEIEASISEYDISEIEEGQSVLIKTDATGDDELTGTVTFVSPVAKTSTSTSTTALTTSSGDVNYAVTISIDTPDDRLRLDMSASLSIIIEQYEDAMTVPYNAVQTDEDGNTYVEVLDESGMTDTTDTTGGDATKADAANTDEAVTAEASTEMEMPSMGGADASGAPQGNMPSGGPGDDSSQLTATYKKVYVTVELESNYYTAVSSDELKEGMKVRVVESNSDSTDDFMMMDMGGGMGGF